MGVLATIRKVLPSWLRKSFSVQGVPELRFGRIGWEQFRDRVITPYSQNAWVQAAVSAKSTALSGVPFRFYTGKRGTEQKQPLPETHEWVLRFQRPSPLFPTWSELAFSTMLYRDIYGEAPYVALGPDGDWMPGTVPAELYLAFPPCLYEEVNTVTQMVDRWRMNDGTGQQVLPPEQVGNFKRRHPENPHRGLSPLLAVRWGMDFTLAAQNFNAALMRNGADPGGIVKTEGVADWTLDQHRAARAKWEDRHQGTDKAGRVGFMDKDAEYQQLIADNRKLQLREHLEWSRDEVKAVLHVTDWELGSVQDFSYASAQQAQRTFWAGLKSEGLALEDFLWSWLFLPYSRRMGVNVWGEFDFSAVPALRFEFTERVASVAALAPHYGINEINRRLDLGMPDVPWGDEPAGAAMPLGDDESVVAGDGEEAVPVSAGAVADTALNGAQIASLVDIVAQVTAGTLPATSAIGLILVSFPTIDEAEAARIVNAADAAPPLVSEGGPPVVAAKSKAYAAEMKGWQDTAEKVMVRAARDYFRGLRALALGNMRGRKAAAGDAAFVDRVLGDIDAWGGVAEASFRPSIAKIVEQMKRALKRQGFDVFPPDKELKRLAEARLAQLVKVSRRDRTRLGNRLKSFIEEHPDGYSVDDMAKEIDKHFKTQNSGRAMTIARTESGMVGGQIRQKTFEANGVEQLQWSAANDEFTRESHKRVDGEVVNIGKKFSNGLKHPSEPGAPAAEVINCRCVAVPA